MVRTQSPSLNTAEEGPTVIAVDGGRNSQFAVQWAMEHLLKRNSSCVLIHVQTQSLDAHDAVIVPKQGRPPTEAELHKYFLHFRGLCARKGIVADELVLHDIDVTSALTYYVNENHISNVVVGAPHWNSLIRRLKHAHVPTNLAKSLSQSCTLYVISKGKVQNIRPTGPIQNIKGSTTTAIKDIITLLQESPLDHPPEVTPYDLHAFDEDLNSKPSKKGIKWEPNNIWVYFNENKDATLLVTSRKFDEDIISPKGPRLSATESTSSQNSSNQSSPANSDNSGLLAIETTDTMSLRNQEVVVNSNNSKHNTSSKPKKRLDAEIRKLKLDLKKTTKQYGMACREVESAKHKAMELEKLRHEKERGIEKAKLVEEVAVVSVKLERIKTKLPMESAEKPQRLPEKETQKGKKVEIRARNDKEERNRALNTSIYKNVPYRRYDIKDIEVATNYFDDALQIGEGGYGPVFRGKLNHTVVAIKVVRPDLAHGERQFQQEVDILSAIRHPNMVLLLGACPEFGCLVYEYMNYGSLEDRLFRKDSTRPIPWKIRFSIASQIATALLFLHQTKPEPLVHRDLKPANILLDRNYVSKIGDVGLARLVPPSVADKTTQYRLTSAAGTFCYIDPEYQQTGKLGVKSDIYSFGVMLLQIITARPPMGLSHLVEMAIEDGHFKDVLDPNVIDWPVEEALSCAKLALKCCELRKRDRPDLATVILPELNRLKDLGGRANANNEPFTFFKKELHD